MRIWIYNVGTLIRFDLFLTDLWYLPLKIFLCRMEIFSSVLFDLIPNIMTNFGYQSNQFLNWTFSWILSAPFLHCRHKSSLFMNLHPLFNMNLFHFWYEVFWKFLPPHYLIENFNSYSNIKFEIILKFNIGLKKPFQCLKSLLLKNISRWKYKSHL